MVEKIETITCPVCKGDSTPYNPCEYCNNEHTVKMTIKQEGRTVIAILKCDLCFGTGKTLDGNKCYKCNGTGTFVESDKRPSSALGWAFVAIDLIILLFVLAAKAPLIVIAMLFGASWVVYEVLKRII